MLHIYNLQTFSIFLIYGNFFGNNDFIHIFAVRFLSGVLLDRITGLIGKMLEWLKRHAWKACIPQKGIPSSNLGLSAPFLTSWLF